VHLWVTPFGPPFFERFVRLLSRKIIYDIDDLVFLKNKNEANALITGIKGFNKPIYLMKTADHVIVSTPYLEQYVKQYNNNVTDISAAINTELYTPKQNYNSNGTVIIGWSGSHSTVRMLHAIDDVFQELALNYNFKLFVMGDADFHLPGVNFEAIPWKEDYEVDVIRSFDIGVYPLPDEQWVLGKTGLKALQYMAVGVPTIATAVGANFRVVENGVSGFLVKSKDEWKNALVELIENENLRREFGKKSAEIVEEKFSINALKKTYLQVLEKSS
jgi:glycosyltransferase involved in cell wall biosynthesis